jgi:hypothetical protein
MKYDNHCRKTGCSCDHTACVQGWMNDTTYTTTPCPYCRADTYNRWFSREQARLKDYPMESLNRIMRGH